MSIWRRWLTQNAGGDRTAALAEVIERAVPERAERVLSLMSEGLADDASEEDRYRAAEAAAGSLYPKYKFSEFGRIFLEDQEFLSYYKKFMDADNWHSLDRKYTLAQLMKLTLHLPGDVAECGAYKGASAHLMCRAHCNSGRLVHLFDSFEGLSAPGDNDGAYWVVGALSAPEEALHQALAGFDNYRTYKGWIPERFREVAERRFGFVHIDVDLYHPTLESLNFFYERTLASGIILMDDYGFKTCPGVKQAADAFFDDRPESIAMLPTGQAFVIKR